MFDVRNYTKEDYGTVSLWWKQWGWDGIPEVFLPENGVVVSSGGNPICAAFVYKTDTPICWIENYISDKEADRETRSEALDLLILSCVEKAKSMGALVAISSIKHNVLARRLEKNGFVVSDKNMTAYTRSL